METKIYLDLENKFIIKHTRRKTAKEVLEENYPISNFILEPKHVVICDNFIEYHVKLIKKDKKPIDIVFNGQDFVTVIKFKNKLLKTRTGAQFSGNDSDLSKVLEILDNETGKEVRGLSYIGLTKQDDEWIYIDKNTNHENIVVQDDVFLQYSITENNFPTLEEMNKLNEFLFSFNNDKIVYTVLSSISTCFLNPRFENLGFKIPILQFVGESGSGKSTTLEDLLISCFYEVTPENAGNLKEFSSGKQQSESNLFPHIVEEYKPHKMAKNKVNLLSDLTRNSYDRHCFRRGNPDQTIREYKLISPMIIVGEVEFSETALKERVLVTYFQKMGLDKYYDKVSMIKDSQNALNKLGSLLLNEAINIKDDYLLEMYDYYSKKIKNEKLPSRIAHNIVVSCISYKLFISSFRKYDIEINKQDKVFNILIESQKDFNLNFESDAKSVVENTLETISNAIESGYISKEHFLYENDKLFLRTSLVYNSLTRYIKDHNIRLELYEESISFLNQIQKTKYFIKNKFSKRIEGKTSSCLVLDTYEMFELDVIFKENKVIDITEKQYNKEEREAIQEESELPFERTD